MIGRETLTAADLEAMAVAIGLPLARPAWSAVGIVNGIVSHYAPAISKAPGKEVAQLLRQDAAAEKQIAAAALRFSAALKSSKRDGISTDLLAAVALRGAEAEAAVQSMKVVWGSARAGQHDMRDFMGGALPAAFAVIFGKGSIAQRDEFIGLVCQHAGLKLGKPSNTDAIKKAVDRHNRARRSGAAVNLPGWMGT